MSYAAVGATQAPDLLSYPPRGFRPVEQRYRIGHGDARFEHSCSMLLSWGVQEGSGMTVERVQPPSPGPVAPGDTVVLRIPVGPLRFRAPCRVIYLVEEPGRRGFAYGTLKGHPESGEVCFAVEQADDGLVWLAIRSFSRASTWYYRLASPAMRWVQRRYTRRYVAVLMRPLHSSA